MDINDLSANLIRDTGFTLDDQSPEVLAWITNVFASMLHHIKDCDIRDPAEQERFQAAMTSAYAITLNALADSLFPGGGAILQAIHQHRKSPTVFPYN